MFKKGLITCLLLLSVYSLQAQQYGLYQTKTLFDGFENPAQKVFTLDSSRRFASNLLLPYLGLSASNKGNSEFVRRLINEHIFSADDLQLDKKGLNTIQQQANIYLLTFRIFLSHKHQKELGFSWQTRTDATLTYTNETLALFNSSKGFTESINTKGAFNNNGYLQSYHQFSTTYRENLTKQLSLGIKLSLLSGISYNGLNISKSNVSFNETTRSLNATFSGSYKATFVDKNDLSARTLIPDFKNPGVSMSLGTSYQANSGVFLMANLKDLGVIRWNKDSYIKTLNNKGITIINGPGNGEKIKIDKEITDALTKNPVNSRFYSLTNAKADAMISKSFGFYTPSLIVSKNLFFKGGDVAMVNKFSQDEFSITAIPTYNLNNLFFFGLQGMYQTPNFEFFMGSDNLFKTIGQTKDLINKTSTGSGYNGASFFIGLGIKFGNTVEHPKNSSYIPVM